ncbi:hypothetical protein NIIDMKKI_20900 [Mycobacterium kansasii]|uniref:Nucleoside diphosphate kinase n=1 Tax=Mycobacterium kansasii TaxID=1768 RepID=A0A7G1I8X3_MYCKA|nr:hypothetical protein NIIDMKKI_20900 [Mycobacterium kansasii]
MTGQPQGPADSGDPTPRADPWKSFGAVMAATLLLEAIVVLLAIPVVGAVGGGLSPASLGYLIGLAAALILLAGLQRRPWAIWVNLGVQLVLLAGFAVYPGVGFVGVLFTGVWVLIAYFRAEVRRRQRGERRRQAEPGLPCEFSVGHLLLATVTERTLVLIKPDGVQRGLIGEIIGRIERKGLTVAALELRNVNDELAGRHYAEHEGKPFFGSLLEFITSGPVVAAVVEGPRAVAAFRQLAGGTDPVDKATPGTIRGDFGLKPNSTWCTAQIRPSRRSARSRSGFPAPSAGRRACEPDSPVYRSDEGDPAQ